MLARTIASFRDKGVRFIMINVKLGLCLSRRGLPRGLEDVTKTLCRAGRSTRRASHGGLATVVIGRLEGRATSLGLSPSCIARGVVPKRRVAVASKGSSERTFTLRVYESKQLGMQRRSKRRAVLSFKRISMSV